MKKNILVVAKHNKVEALRVAAGLTLLDDAVRLAVMGGLEDTEAVRVQMEVLEFAEVPMQRYDEHAFADPALVRDLLGADAIYIL